MLNKIVNTLLLATAFLLGSVSLAAQTETAETAKTFPDNVPGLLVKVNKAFVAKDYVTFRDALQRLHELRPNNSEYMYQLVIAHALLDEKSPAYGLMLRMQQEGLSYDFTTTDSTMNIRGTEVFEYLNNLMVDAGNPVGEAESVFTLPESVLMPEAMTWDESRKKFLVGTIVEGKVLAVDKNGRVTELLKADKANGMWSIFDVLVDQARNRLWISSAAVPVFAGFDPVDNGRSALFEYDLTTLQQIHRYPVPADGRPHILGNMALSPNGDIYIVDRTLPLVYSKPAGEKKLKAIIASRDMISMRGIALQPDGNIMYLADRELGILVVDVKGSRALKLAASQPLNLGGIDGLYLWNNSLIVMQNGIKPQRIMRLQLDASGTKVESVVPLAVARPEFDYPSFGVVLGDDLYYLASSQLADNPEKRKPVTVLRTPLDSGQGLEQPDMEYFLKQGRDTIQDQQSETPKQGEKHDKPGGSGGS